MRAAAVAILACLIAAEGHAATPGRVDLADYLKPGDEADAWPAFSAAIKALCPQGGLCGGVIQLPAGVLRISKTIDVPDGIQIQGVGAATVLVSTANQCSGSSAPSVLLHFHRRGRGLGQGGLASLTVTADEDRHMSACAPPPIERNASSQSFQGGSGAFDGCYVDSDGERKFDGTRMNSVGVLVDGFNDGHFAMQGVRACGLGTGIVLKEARGGNAELTFATLNNTGLVIEGGADWTFENLMFHANSTALILRPDAAGTPPRNIQVLGGLFQSNFRQAIAVHGCENCTFTGIHEENNGKPVESGGDVHIDGSGLTRHFSIVGARHSAWPSSLVENGDKCLVDYVTFDDDTGMGWNNTVEVRSACPLHLNAEPSWLGLRRHASPSPGALTVFDAGPSALRMEDTGQLGLGSSSTQAALTVHAPSPEGRLLDLISEQQGLRLKLTSDARRSPSFVDVIPSGLQLRSGSGFLQIQRDGRVSVGQAPSQAKLTVKGGMSAESISADGLLLLKSGTPSCDEAHRGVMAAGKDGPQICLRTNGAYRWATVSGQ